MDCPQVKTVKSLRSLYNQLKRQRAQSIGFVENLVVYKNIEYANCFIKRTWLGAYDTEYDRIFLCMSQIPTYDIFKRVRAHELQHQKDYRALVEKHGAEKAFEIFQLPEYEDNAKQAGDVAYSEWLLAFN